jgi:valyl-tRNA synthetase
MIMMGLHFMQEIPFRDVYIHALVRDAEGQKMSKSKGNVIDPLEMTEQFGTDAFRFTLVAFAAQGRDIKMSAERIEGYRNFANKIWNASRFVLMNLEADFVPNSDILVKESSLADRWIVSRLNTITRDVQGALTEYRFNDAASALYQFIWHEYCDWYVELSKPALKSEEPGRKKAAQTTLVMALERALRLLHPIMPFITEEIWQKLPGETRGGKESIMIASFPQSDDRYIDQAIEESMRLPMDTILSIRNIRGEMNISPRERVRADIRAENGDVLRTLEQTVGYVTSLAGLSHLALALDTPKPQGSATGTIRGAEIYVTSEQIIDRDAERDRLRKEIAKTSKDIELFSKKLSNKSFVEKAPKAVVEKDTARLEELNAIREKLEQGLKMLGE